ncbi:hypothetical protein ABI125_08685 [Tamlana crocina]
MAIIITYDINKKHTEFKTEMATLGYKDQIPGTVNCKIIYFPNTTLYHKTKSSSEARDDAQTISKKLNIDLERCVASIWENWAAICGSDFK